MVLVDLVRAFGPHSALSLGHTCEAVHSMLSSLQPDNNVRIHALLYLAAVDDYVSAVNSGEMSRNVAALTSRRRRVTAAAAASSPQVTYLHVGPHHSAAAEVRTSMRELSLCGDAGTSQQQQQQQQQSADTSSPLPPLSTLQTFNLVDVEPPVPVVTHVFTADELAQRRAAVSTGGKRGGGSSHTTKPFYCVACRYAFREGQSALILPCTHTVHEQCATRLRSDWCPRCFRPFERAASSTASIQDFHDAQARLALLVTRWAKHILLPPHLWFAEWRRVRLYVVARCDEERAAAGAGGGVTWCQSLVDTQILFAVPDDFSPSAYGLSDVPIMAALAALGLLAANRQHDRTVAMVHESLVDGSHGTSTSTSSSRGGVSFATIKC